MSTRVHVCACVYTRVCAGSELTPWPQLSNKNPVDSARPAPSALRSAFACSGWGCAGGSLLCWRDEDMLLPLKVAWRKAAATAGQSLGLNHQCLGTTPPHTCVTPSEGR